MTRHILLPLVFVGISSAMVAILRPGWASTAGLDVWNLPELERNLIAEQQNFEELNQRNVCINARILAKEQVIGDLVAGRLTLLKAAALFRRLNTEIFDYPETTPPDYFPGRTENERLCNQVLRWATAMTYHWTPSHAEEILCRLKAELEAHLALHGGEVLLPED